MENFSNARQNLIYLIGLTLLVDSGIYFLLGPEEATSTLLGYAMLAINIFFVVMVLNAKKAQQGFLSFGEGFKTYFLFHLVRTLLDTVFLFLFVTVINPNYLLLYKKKIYQEMSKAGTESLEVMMKVIDFILTPTGMVSMSLIGSLIFGLIVALIIGAAMKKKKPFISFEE